nr:MAG TPA: hypothetical protein [Caudoviricetes sp.]
MKWLLEKIIPNTSKKDGRPLDNLVYLFQEKNWMH